MKTKTKYQLYWWCAYPEYSKGWYLTATTTSLNSKVFQQLINYRVSNGDKFKVVHITEEVIYTDKTFKKR